MLKTVAISSGGGGSGTVTNVATGTGLTGGPITTTGTIALANTAVTAGTYGNASTVAQVTINAQGQVTNAVNVAITVASGNVTGLGTMATQNANAVVITGGTVNIPNFFPGYTASTAANATTALSATANYWQKITASGANTQTFTLPNATTLSNGAAYIFDNDAGGNVTINDNGSTLVDTLVPGAVDFKFLESNATAAGSWGKYSWLPAYVNWGTSTADFGGVAVSNLSMSSSNVTITGGSINVQATNVVSTTSSTATFATSSLPLVPAGYIQVDLNGTVVKVPYYAV